MSWIELAAVVFGLLSVWLTVRQHMLCWPTGLVMVLLYAWIFFSARLYSDAILQVVYIVLCVYGWIHWKRGGVDQSELAVSSLSPLMRCVWVGVGLGSAGLLGCIMDVRTDAALPYWDAATTTLSLVAQWLLTRKRVESWAFWIAVDVVAIGVYLAKGLYLTSGLYTVFLILAIMGLLSWQRGLRAQEALS